VRWRSNRVSIRGTAIGHRRARKQAAMHRNQLPPGASALRNLAELSVGLFPAKSEKPTAKTA